MAYEKTSIKFNELLKKGKAHRCVQLLEKNSIGYDALGRALGISTNYARGMALSKQHVGPHNLKRLDAVATWLEKLDIRKGKSRKIEKE